MLLSLLLLPLLLLLLLLLLRQLLLQPLPSRVSVASLQCSDGPAQTPGHV